MGINYTLEEEKDFVEEDPRSEVIKQLTDMEEIQAAQELLEEKYAGPGEDTPAGKTEPEKIPFKEGEDTSEKPKEKTEEAKEQQEEKKETPGEEKKETPEEEKKDEFTLTDELINKQPEEAKEILSKYKGKGKAEIAQAAANAIAMKNPYLKDNEKAIEAVANKLESGTEDELIKTLVEVQKETGKTEQEKPKEETFTPAEKIELPALPDSDPAIKKILNQEILKRLRKIYPDMPEDITDLEGTEYQEWEKDILDEGGLTKANKLIKDIETAGSSVKSEMQKVIYAQQNLQNLYYDSPSEILQLMKDENLPKLKHLNDNYREINNKTLTSEVELIRANLQNYGITEKDLGVDLSLTKDEKGSFRNDILTPLMMDGNEPDTRIIGSFGKVPVLRKGQLTNKFIFENNAKILTLLVNNKVKASAGEIEKLKDETLNISGNKPPAQKEIIQANDIKNLTDEERIKKIQNEIESKYA